MDKIVKVSRTVRESLDGTLTNNNLTNIVTTLPTNGAAVTVAKFTRKSVFINKLGTVTAIVRVEASADKSTWIILDSVTSSSTPTAYIFSTGDYIPYMRTSVTALIAAATVSTIITGHGV